MPLAQARGRELKAYKLSCTDDDHGAKVVFAESYSQARLCGRGDMCDCGFIDLRCKRAPDFDDLAPGPITVHQYLERGWYWECSACPKHVWGDSGPHVVIDGMVFCDEACVDRKLAEYTKMRGDGRVHESIENAYQAIKTHKAWLEFISINSSNPKAKA
jgi:hypothetical protein